MKARKIHGNWKRRIARLKVLVRMKEEAMRTGANTEKIDREASRLVEYDSKKIYF